MQHPRGGLAAGCVLAAGVLLAIAGLAMRFRAPRSVPVAHTPVPTPGADAPPEPAPSPYAARLEYARADRARLQKELEAIAGERGRLSELLKGTAAQREFLQGLPFIDPELSDAVDWEARCGLERLGPSLARVYLTSPVQQSCPAVVVDADGHLLVFCCPFMEDPKVPARAVYIETGPSGQAPGEDPSATWVGYAWAGVGLLKVKAKGSLCPATLERDPPSPGARAFLYGLGQGTNDGSGVAGVAWSADGLTFADRISCESLGGLHAPSFPVFTTAGTLAGYVCSWMAAVPGPPGAAAALSWSVQPPESIRSLLSRKSDGYPATHPPPPVGPRSTSVTTKPATRIGGEAYDFAVFGNGSLVLARPCATQKGSGRFQEWDILVFQEGGNSPSRRVPLGMRKPSRLRMSPDGRSAVIALPELSAAYPPELLQVKADGERSAIQLPTSAAAIDLAEDGRHAWVLSQVRVGATVLRVDLETQAIFEFSLPEDLLQAPIPEGADDAVHGILVDGENGLLLVWVARSELVVLSLAVPPMSEGKPAIGKVRAISRFPADPGSSTDWLPYLERRSGTLFCGSRILRRSGDRFVETDPLPAITWDEGTRAALEADQGIFVDGASEQGPELVLGLSPDGTRFLTQRALRDTATLECIRPTRFWATRGAFSPDGQTYFLLNHVAWTVVSGH